MDGHDDVGADRYRLLLLRHAKSSWDDAAMADHDRPLAPRGRKGLRRLRDHLAAVEDRPDVVLCSSARRAVETLDGIRPALRRHTAVEIDSALYAADAEDLLARLRSVDDRFACVLLIGHNPGLAVLAELLVSSGDPARRARLAHKFPTAALATLGVDPPWGELRPGLASLDGLWTPRPAHV